MKELFQRIKMDVMIGALICMALGAVLILYPVETTTIVCELIGAAIAVVGITHLVGYFRRRQSSLHLTLGLILLIVGGFILMRPQSIQSLICIGIGVVLFVHGIEDLRYAMETKRGSYENWWLILCMACVSIALGIMCVVDSFGMISITMTVVGIALIYDGISDLWIVSRVNKTARTIRKAAEPIDTEYEEYDMSGSDREDGR